MTRVLALSFLTCMFLLRGEVPPPMAAPPNALRVLTTEAVTPALTAVPGVNVQAANNNLDVVRFGGRTYLAFRTAPTHFASAAVELYVVSSADERQWKLEHRIALGADLREPRLLPVGGQLFLYFAELGRDLLSFEPRRMLATARGADGRWSEPRAIYRPGYIPWRTRTVGGIAHMAAYGDGRHIYDGRGIPLEVHWLTSHDGWTWAPGAGPAAVFKGGASETDFLDLPDGGMVAVSRNEAGDASGWGSKICRAEAGAPAKWSCRSDPRKYDSPLLFRHGADVYLVARRHLSRSGHFDLGLRRLPHGVQTAAYQLDYWRYPKRCAVWRVDPNALTVTWQADLPSRGDTCFPAVTPTGPSTVAVYNYSSPIDGPDLPWLPGQLGRTLIYRSVLQLPERDILAAP